MKKIRIALVIVCITFLLVACHGENTILTPPAELPTEAVNEKEQLDTISTGLVTEASMENMSQSDKYELRQKLDKEYIRAVNDFSKRISSSLLSEQETNKMISPISIQMALALACVGAEGDTGKEIATLLGFDGKENEYLMAQNKNLLSLLQAEDRISKLLIGNSLWLGRNTKFLETYLTNAKENYFADLYEVDFTDQATAELMSSWVSKHTGNLIKPRIELDPEQILSIVNTIYYKDEWINEFQEEDTQPAAFYLADGTTVECDYMHQTHNPHDYYKGNGYISSSLWLKGNGQMYFILPDEGVTVDELLSDPENISKAFFEESNGHAKIIYQIPKFSFDYKINLKEILEELGMKEAFSKEADFSSASEAATIFISDITHQTHIGIDEKGVEAAAFTNLIFFGSAPPQEETIEFSLDRPFLFAIKKEGVMLFIGVVNNPLE